MWDRIAWRDCVGSWKLDARSRDRYFSSDLFDFGLSILRILLFNHDKFVLGRFTIRTACQHICVREACTKCLLIGDHSKPRNCNAKHMMVSGATYPLCRASFSARPTNVRYQAQPASKDNYVVRWHIHVVFASLNPFFHPFL